MEWRDPKTDKPELDKHCIAVMSDATLRTFFCDKGFDCDYWIINGEGHCLETLVEPFESIPLRPYILYWAYIDFSTLPKCKWDGRMPCAPDRQNIVGETEVVTEIKGDSGFKAHWKMQEAMETEATIAEKKRIEESNERLTREYAEYIWKNTRDDLSAVKDGSVGES